MHKLWLILALALGPAAFADTAIWNCNADAKLHGDADFFMRYGRDSWKGRASLNCQSDDQTASKDVDITFNGVGPGYGVSETSVITLQLNITTSTPPENFEVYAIVLNGKGSGTINWRSESSGILVEAKVISEDIPSIQSSLQRGNLYIR